MKLSEIFVIGAVVAGSSLMAEDEPSPAREGYRFEKKAEQEDRRGQRGSEMERELFKRFDKDGDGVISKEEFYASPRMEELPDEQREKIFSRVDLNGDGKLTLEEIREMRRHAHERKQRELRDLDTDNSGGLNFEEFSQGKFFKKLTEERRKQIFARMDTDGSGEIDAEDRPEPPLRRHREDRERD